MNQQTELEKKASAAKAELEKQAKQKHLRYYDVKIEAQLQAILVYKILAASPEEAAEKAVKSQPVSVKHDLARKRLLKGKVFESGSSIVRFVKNFFR